MAFAIFGSLFCGNTIVLKPKTRNIERSDFLKASAAVVGSSFLPSIANTAPVAKKAPIRVAHLSDIHLKEGGIAEAGMAKAFHHAQDLRPKVDFIINGGDAIFDSLQADSRLCQI